MSKSGGVDSIVLIKLPLSKWHAYINEPTVADAILDRLTAKYFKIELKRKFLRKSTYDLLIIFEIHY